MPGKKLVVADDSVGRGIAVFGRGRLLSGIGVSSEGAAISASTRPREAPVSAMVKSRSRRAA